MRFSWTTIFLIGGLAVLLTALGLLQYGWLSRISASDGEKARKQVQDQADRFAMDFNREIQNAYFNFQTDPETWKAKDWTAFNERYDFWKEKTSYPDLIRDFYFFEARNGSAPLRYDKDRRSFATVEVTEELSDLQKRFTDDKTFKPVYDDSYTLVLPIHDAGQKVAQIMLRTPSPAAPILSKEMTMPPKFGYLVIRLDGPTIKEKILPDLAAKYFGDGEFLAAVVDGDGKNVFQGINGETGDASAPLMRMSPDNFIFYGNKDLMRTVEGVKLQDVRVSSRVESHTFEHVQPDEKQGTVKIEIKKDAKPRTSVFTATTSNATAANGPWTLLVQHSSGSIDTFISNTLRRNLAIGFGILFLLAAAIAAIIISTQRARQLAQRQVDFVSSVSHEFRTPLAVIYSAGENLADGVAKEDTQVARYGELIKGEGKKLTGMVEQILDFAGANSGRKQYNFVDTNIADLIGDAIGECRPLIDGKGIQLETDLPDTLSNVKADRAALSGAIQNLIVNSVKYGNGSNWLKVSAVNGGGTVKLSVEDRGIGISERELARIFEPFYRSRDVVDAQIHGNGLGLSLVKQIAEAHGGRVYARSEIGKGSKFTIELPQK